MINGITKGVLKMKKNLLEYLMAMVLLIIGFSTLGGIFYLCYLLIDYLYMVRCWSVEVSVITGLGLFFFITGTIYLIILSICDSCDKKTDKEE